MAFIKRFFFIIIVGLIFSTLGISLISYTASSRAKDHYVLFFSPRGAEESLKGEIRYLPRQDTREERIEILLDELCLGPVNINYNKILPAGTRLQSVRLNKDRVYADFSPRILFTQDEVSLTYEEILQAIEKNLRFNFRFIDDVVITINGQEPQSPYFSVGNGAKKK